MITEPINNGRYRAGAGRPLDASSPDGRQRIQHCWKVPAVAASGNGGILAWKNPVGYTINIDEVRFVITTQTGGACTADVGTAADGTTSSDNLIDGLSLATAGQFGNLGSPGTNGKQGQRLTSSQYITATVASGTVTGLVGYFLIRATREDDETY